MRRAKGLVSLALYQAIIMSALASGRPWLVAVMDVAVIDLLSERIGSPFSHFPGIEPRTYLDSPASLPVYVDLPAYGERLAEADEAIHSILFRGRRASKRRSGRATGKTRRATRSRGSSRLRRAR